MIVYHKTTGNTITVSDSEWSKFKNGAYKNFTTSKPAGATTTTPETVKKEEAKTETYTKESLAREIKKASPNLSASQVTQLVQAYERSGWVGSEINKGNVDSMKTYVDDREEKWGVSSGTGDYTYSGDQLSKKANDAAVNTLYQSYFGRDASRAELDNWGSKGGSDTTVQALEDFLKTERTRYGAEDIPVRTLQDIKTGVTVQQKREKDQPITGQTEGLTAEQKKMIDELNIDIDAWEGLSFEQKAILKEIAAGEYTSGQRIPSTQELTTIIEDAAKMAEQDISPYYEKVSGRELEDVRTSMADIRNEASRYSQQEELGYKDALAKTKQTLRARGLTFSGKSRGVLGSEGALDAAGVEGALPTERRYNWEDARADWQERSRDIGTAAERQLGSANIEGVEGLADPYGGGTTYDKTRTSALYKPSQQGEEGYVATGDLELQRLKELEKAKWDKVGKYRAYI